MMKAYQKLVKMERYATRRDKVFAKRARKLGWPPESIISALKYGVRYFRPF
jgi:hypothetical protein